MKTSCARLLLVAGLMSLPAASAWAVRPKTWNLDQPADLLSGTLQDIAVTSQAELLLAPQVERFALEARDADTVNALAIGPDDIPYVGTGPKGIIYRIVNKKVEKVADLREGQVFSMLTLPDKTLLAGVGGTRGAIYRVGANGKTSLFWHDPDVRYVWSMARDDDGNIYAATGSDGAIFKIGPDGKAAEKLARISNTHNVLSVAMAGANRLAFGTDDNGLIGAINTKTGRLHILYDAGHRSITALVGEPNGTVYAAATAAGSEGNASDGPPRRPQGHPDMGTCAANTAQHGVLDASVGTATNPSRDHGHDAHNTIYRIGPEGLTTVAVKLPTMLLGMAQQGHDLLISTGNPGRIYRLQPRSERYISLLRENASYFTTIKQAGKSFWIGASRPAEVVLMKPEHAAEGAFTSAPLDANLLSLWGQVRVNGTIPDQTAVTVQTRSGNTQDVTESGWSAWSQPKAITCGERPLVISPPGRFLQVRLVLKSGDDRQQTPAIRSISVPYQAFNLPPEIASVSVTTPNAGAKPPASEEKWYEPDTNVTIEWAAHDPNDDRLSCDVYVRRVGTTKWTRIAANLTDSTYKWDSEPMADGRYEARVVASDASDNPPNLARSTARISEPFIVDRTGPRLRAVKIRPAGKRTFHVEAQIVDKLSTIIAAQYSLDSGATWTPLLPVDGIFDSPDEALGFDVGPLTPGEHVVSIRTADEQGNTTSTWRTVTVTE